MFPRFFRSLGWLKALNVAGVGLGLASLVAVVFGHLLSGVDGFAHASMVMGLATLAPALLWAWMLRWRRLHERPWLAGLVSVGLAAGVDVLIVSLRTAALLGWGRVSEDVGQYALQAATVDMLLWGPALLVSWVCFGLPVRRARELAAQGLAGEERGEKAVGTVVAAVSGLAWLVFGLVGEAPRNRGWALRGPDGEGVAPALMALGVLAGLGARALAARRERRRRQFVREVEEQGVPGYRVDTTAAGKVLVRVAAAGRDDYRAAEADAELFALDEDGAALRARPVGQRG